MTDAVNLQSFRFLSSSRLGFRGAILLILGVGDLGYGMSLILPSHETRVTESFQWREQFMPTQAWGAIWLVVGAALIIHAFAHRDAVGYMLAIGIKVSWATVSIGSFVLGGVGNGLAAAISWLILTLIIAVISGWPEPVRYDQSPATPDDSEES